MILADTELKGIAAQALNLAKRDLERNQFNFLFASYHIGDTPPLHRMKKVERLVIERLGVGWLNSGRAKDAGFAVLRKAIDIMPPDGVVFATVINKFTPTAKFNALPEDKKLELADHGHDRHHEAVKEGLFTINDAICAIVQTPQMVCNYIQDLDPRGKPIGTPDVQLCPQSAFGGRLKMFGEEVDFTKLRARR